MAGRSEIFINRKPTILHYANQMGITNQLHISEALIGEGEGSFILFSKIKLGTDSKEIAQEFSTAIKELQEQRIIEKITNSYLMPVN